MEDLKFFEKQMIEWQNGVRILYKDLQEFHNWTDDQVWEELKNELRRICLESEYGEDDLAWTRELLTSKRDITLMEAIRLSTRFKHSTPLLDAFNNLRYIKNKD